MDAPPPPSLSPPPPPASPPSPPRFLKRNPSLDEALEVTDEFLTAMRMVLQYKTNSPSGDSVMTNDDGSTTLLRTKDEMKRSLIFQALSLVIKDPSLQRTVAEQLSERNWETIPNDRFTTLHRRLAADAREIINWSALNESPSNNWSAPNESPENKAGDGEAGSSGMSWGRKLRMSLEVQRRIDWFMSIFMAACQPSNPNEGPIITLKTAVTVMIILKRVYSSQ